MRYDEWLYLKLIEEASEVQHRASKLMQFGADEIQPGYQQTNMERLVDEVIDFSAVLSLAEIKGLVKYNKTPDDIAKAVEAKLTKLDHYLKLSIQLGLVEPEVTVGYERGSTE